jgi:hypothetical protein
MTAVIDSRKKNQICTKYVVQSNYELFSKQCLYVIKIQNKMITYLMYSDSFALEHSSDI